jgi:hypothetical protein
MVGRLRREDPSGACAWGAREILRNNKVFPCAADHCNEQARGFRRNHTSSPGTPENNLPWRKQHGDEVTPSDGILSTPPSRPVARVCAEIRAGQGLVARSLAPDFDFLLPERVFFGYSKPSHGD